MFPHSIEIKCQLKCKLKINIDTLAGTNLKLSGAEFPCTLTTILRAVKASTYKAQNRATELHVIY